MRHLILILGDQLDRRSAAFDGFDARADVVWMTEASHESTKVWVSKPRIAVFLAAMRQFAAALRAEGIDVDYRSLDGELTRGSRPAQRNGHHLTATARRCRRRRRSGRDDPRRPARRDVAAAPPGARDRRRAGRMVAARGATGRGVAAGVPWEERPDRHFLCSREAFAAHANGRRQLRMEYFYRDMRRRIECCSTPTAAPRAASGTTTSRTAAASARAGRWRSTRRRAARSRSRPMR